MVKLTVQQMQNIINKFNNICKEKNYDYKVFPLGSEEFEAILNPALDLTVDDSSSMYVLISDNVVSFFWDASDVCYWIDDLAEDILDFRGLVFDDENNKGE